MKWTEWLVAIFLVVIGLSCLTMSATSMLNSGSFQSYVKTFFHICFWIGIPALVLGIFYIIFKRGKGDS